LRVAVGLAAALALIGAMLATCGGDEEKDIIVGVRYLCDRSYRDRTGGGRMSDDRNYLWYRL
jgi:hypothetical protein